ITSASLFLALVMLAGPVWRSSQRPPLLVFFYVLAVSALVLACGLLQLNYMLRCRKEAASEHARARLSERPAQKQNRLSSGNDRVALQFSGSLAIWLIAAVLAYLWSTLLAYKDNDYGLFFGYRTLHMASGVSPFSPLLPLLAATYLWGLFEIWRLRFNDV